MKYRHFLFDLDDTLLDFKASERLSFQATLAALGIGDLGTALFADYQRENMQLWADFERGLVSKDHVKVERFQRIFARHRIDADPETASRHYLGFLPESLVLIEGAAEVCESLSRFGEIVVITNGIETVQRQRIVKSGLDKWVSFVATSEACGYAKPDVRFFEFSASRFRTFRKTAAVIVGDRLDTDIMGASQFGIDSCWFNPLRTTNNSQVVPTFEVAQLSEIAAHLATARRPDADHNDNRFVFTKR